MDLMEYINNIMIYPEDVSTGQNLSEEDIQLKIRSKAVLNGIDNSHETIKWIIEKCQQRGLTGYEKLEQKIRQQQQQTHWKPLIVDPDLEYLTKPEDFFVTQTPTEYTLHNIQYPDRKLYTVSWTKQLLNNGSHIHSQEYWLRLYPEYIPSGIDYFTSILALHENRQGPQKELIEEIRQMHAKDFTKYLMITSTIVQYTPEGLDTVIHNYKSQREEKTKANITGPDGYITQTNWEKALQALTGTNNTQKIEEVIQWVTQKPVAIRKPNKKPKRQTERALVLGGYAINQFIIYAYCGIDCMWPARGVRAQKLA